jgi:hypothetical protein
MHKLPVFATVGNAVAFAFGNFFTVLRLAWLPFTAYLLATGAFAYFAQASMFEEIWATDKPDIGAMFRHVGDMAYLYVAMVVLQVIVVSAVAVSIHKVILFGDRKPGDYFVFAFGRAEFFYALMVALSFLGFLTLMAAILTPIAYAISGGDFAAFFAQFKDWPEIMPDLVQSGAFGMIMTGYALGWLVLLYFALRLAVWPPAVVATGRLALGEAWSLTRGNVLRILGMFIVMVVVIWLIAIPIGIVVGVLAVPFAMHHAGTLKDVNGPAAMHEMMRDVFTPYLLPVFAVELVFYVFFTGLCVAILSYAYKALKGVDAKAPLPHGG